MQEHIEKKKHRGFFKERGEEYSSSQCKACEENIEGKEEEGKVGSTEADGPRDKPQNSAERRRRTMKSWAPALVLP